MCDALHDIPENTKIPRPIVAFECRAPKARVEAEVFLNLLKRRGSMAGFWEFLEKPPGCPKTDTFDSRPTVLSIVKPASIQPRMRQFMDDCSGDSLRNGLGAAKVMSRKHADADRRSPLCMSSIKPTDDDTTHQSTNARKVRRRIAGE